MFFTRYSDTSVTSFEVGFSLASLVLGYESGRVTVTNHRYIPHLMPYNNIAYLTAYNNLAYLTVENNTVYHTSQHAIIYHTSY